MPIRSINKAYEELKARDPETSISKKMIREIVNNEKIPSIKAGNRRYVDVDVLEDYVAQLAGVRIMRGREVITAEDRER